MMSTTMAALEQRLVERGFLQRDQIDRAVARFAPREASELLQKLVEQGDLTKFQAKTIDRGRIDSLCFGPYLILDMVGKGGMSVIFRARHRHMRRLVALKVISPEIEKDPTAVQRFWREVHAIAQLDHPHIVKAYDAGEESGRMYLAMELIQGVNCSELVKGRGAAQTSLALKIVGQAASGLAYAHASGIVHRDVKPSNLFLSEQSSVKVLDLGLALLYKGPTEATAETGLTQTGIVMGTADYMAPEQARGRKDLDGRADIYSLGCTLYFLLTGERPFHGANVIDVILAHSSAPIPTLARAGLAGTGEIQELLGRMMEKDPRRRIGSMNEVIDVVGRLRAGTDETGESDPTIRIADSPVASQRRSAASDSSPGGAGRSLGGKRLPQSGRGRGRDADSGGTVKPKSDSIPSFMDVSATGGGRGTEAQEGSRTIWWWGGTVLGALLVCGGLAYFFPWRSGASAGAAQGGAAATTGEVQLDLSGDLTGIELTINGKPHPAETSTSLTLDPGRYEIVATRQGVVAKKHVVQIQPGQRLSVLLDLGARGGAVQQFKVR